MDYLTQSKAILKSTFGYSDFRGSQESIIHGLCQGHDSLVIMPTGGGKSLCYQIPALLRPGMGLVISPLIALMQDQVTALQQLGIRAAFLNSMLDQNQKQDLYAKIMRGEIEVLYLAPERLLQTHTLEWLKSIQISLIAIDEAHCVAQWGHDFRQDYLELGTLREHFTDVPRVALTATATHQTQQEIVTNLQLDQPKQYIASFDRPNIHYSVRPRKNGKQQLLNFLKGRESESGVVYCLSRKKVESTAQWLQSKGFNALPYHAGLEKEVRSDHLEKFLRQDVIIVATIAFGMGIDKPDVRFVCHLDLPKSMEAYYQETGRAGRDGQHADAWMVYGLNDVVQLTQMVDDSSLVEERKFQECNKLNALLGWCEETSCRRISLLAYFGEDLKKPCGNCDTCSTTPPRWDATIAAQKLLSCILRTGQRFGSAYVLEVLLGKEQQRIIDNGHHLLSTYGIGKEYEPNQWRSILRQLIVKQIVIVDSSAYGALKLTDNARPLLKSESKLFLRKDLEEATKYNKKDRKQVSVSDSDRQLWQALRECRSQIAAELEIPAYQIFHDATLMQMMEFKPKNSHQLLTINGVGETKLDRFGHQFLEVIQEYID